MKACYFYEPGKMKLEEVEIPKINDDELLLKVRATAICGTDMRILKNGHFKIKTNVKRVLGHEIVGDIVQVGSTVKGFTEGMRVSVTPNIGCGVCGFCRDGYNNMCADYEAFGVSIDGGFEEYMRIPQIAIKGGNIFILPDNVSYEEAVLAEPMSCCYNALLSLGTTHEDVVLIIGAGPIGALHVMLNKIAGAKKIIVADIREDRLERMVGFGADVTINSAKIDLRESLMEETDGKGADVIITAVSVPSIQAEAVQLLNTHGRVNFFAGLGKDVVVPIDTNRVHYKGLKLVGTTGSTNSNYFKCLTLIKEGNVDVKKLISATYKLSEIDEAFKYAISAEGMKTLIVN